MILTLGLKAPEPQKPEPTSPYIPEVIPEIESIIEDNDNVPPGTLPHIPERLPGKDNLNHVKRHVSSLIHNNLGLC